MNLNQELESAEEWAQMQDLLGLANAAEQCLLGEEGVAETIEPEDSWVSNLNLLTLHGMESLSLPQLMAVVQKWRPHLESLGVYLYQDRETESLTGTEESIL